MTAQLRDYYLSTLEIVQYVPREFCVVAPSVPVQSGQAEVAVPVEAQPAAVELAPSAVARKRPPIDLDILGSGPGVTAKESRKASLPAKVAIAEAEDAAADATEAGGQAESDVRFRISSWQPSPDVMVFGSLAYGQNPQQDQQQLLANILKAIGHLPSSLSEPELLDWPTIPSAPADAAGAHFMFSAFLNARLQQGKARWVLILGDTARKYLVPSDREFTDGKAALTETATAISLPGLDEMLAKPECKRAAWEAIRFLAEPSS